MSVELKQHYGWETYAVATPYEAVRQTHTFLTDDNHTWEDDGTSIVVRKNGASPPFAFAPSWVSDGPGALWFDIPYRIKP